MDYEVIPILRSLLTDNAPSLGIVAKPPGSTSSTLFEQWCGFSYVQQEGGKWKCCEIRLTVFRTYPRRLEIPTVCRQHFLLSYLKTPSVGPAGGLNPRLPVQQTGALPTELIRGLIYSYQAFFLLVSAFYDVTAFGYSIFC